MTTATAKNNSPTPRHGYTKDGTPVYAHTRRFVKTDTVAQRINAAVGLRITVLVGTMWCAYVFGEKIQHAIDLLDIHTDGGLHDAVAVIVHAINGKAATSGTPT